MNGRRLDEKWAWRFVLARARRGASGNAGRASGAEPAVMSAGEMRVAPDGTWSSDLDVVPEARDLLDLFLPLAVRERFVVGQLGQSLDGRIATEAGHSHYVTGPEDRVRLHRLRALADAVVIGAGTAASDDPRLTVRTVEGEHPVRVVLDPSGRLDPGLTLFTDGAADTLWVRAAGGRGTPGLVGDRVEVVTLIAEPEAGFAPERLLGMLRARGLARVLVEGGGVTVSRFLAAGALDRLHVTVAPLLIGSGRPALTLPTISSLDEALRPPFRTFRMGSDVLLDLELDRARA
jgi:diaminohydroxyphosphoribosylaminopyrimidine deaminase / 5-amino-6-(5-phosphoribosylamino)uracil reductase